MVVNQNSVLIANQSTDTFSCGRGDFHLRSETFLLANVSYSVFVLTLHLLLGFETKELINAVDVLSKFIRTFVVAVRFFSAVNGVTDGPRNHSPKSRIHPVHLLF
ncbi:hypothetical protein D3C85_225510 [compost metagenome]